MLQCTTRLCGKCLDCQKRIMKGFAQNMMMSGGENNILAASTTLQNILD